MSCWITGAFCQGQRIQGHLRDSINNKPIESATVSLISEKDSILVESTRSQRDGGFIFSLHMPPGSYLLIVTHTSYESYHRQIKIIGKINENLEIIYLQPKADSLESVIVRPKEIRPRMKGDTIEYNTANIQLRPNAVVEEMLGRLPGLQIDASGNITYNGEKIQKLLVDGEDLFGSDPTLVTRNFDASKIAKVQLLDRRSDQSTFTGIDDGNRTKTLNLVLKDDSRNGYFGKAEAGTDPQGIYNFNGLLADFRRREQFTGLGFTSNTGALGFDGNGEGISFLNGNDDALGASAGIGIPRLIAGALHYANSWNGPENHLVGNYQYNHSYTQPLTSSYSIQTLPDSIYTQVTSSRSTNQSDQHWGYVTFDWAADTLMGFHGTFHYTTTASHNKFSDTGYSDINGILVNTSKRNIQDEAGRNSIGGDLSWRIRARNSALRVFSAYIGWASLNGGTDGYVYSLNSFYLPDGSLQSIDTIDQRKQISNQSFTVNGGMNFTQPLWKTEILGITYGLSYTGDEALQGTYDKGDGKYQDYVDSLSSHFRGQQLTEKGYINLQGKGTRFNYVAGLGAQWYTYHQQDLQAGSVSKYSYLNSISFVRINYMPNQVSHIDLNYGGGSQQPTIAQLQPVTNNSNPLFITLGNPNLKPGFGQNWALHYSHLKSWMINLGLNLGVTSNSISTRTTTDSLGRQISQPVNTDGGRTAGLDFSVNKRIGGFDAGFHAVISYSRFVNYIDADLSRNDNYTEGGGFSLGKYVANKYSLQFNTQFSYFDTRNSINTGTPIHYWTQAHNANATFFLVKDFEISTNIVFTWQQATSAFMGSTSVVLWNASVTHNFLANRLVLRLQANNLLNQNAGISRSSSANMNSESSTHILGRFWMLSLVYHFDHKWK